MQQQSSPTISLLGEAMKGKRHISALQLQDDAHAPELRRARTIDGASSVGSDIRCEMENSQSAEPSQVASIGRAVLSLPPAPVARAAVPHADYVAEAHAVVPHADPVVEAHAAAPFANHVVALLPAAPAVVAPPGNAHRTNALLDGLIQRDQERTEANKEKAAQKRLLAKQDAAPRKKTTNASDAAATKPKSNEAPPTKPKSSEATTSKQKPTTARKSYISHEASRCQFLVRLPSLPSRAFRYGSGASEEHIAKVHAEAKAWLGLGLGS
jgi:hypothetical protein